MTVIMTAAEKLPSSKYLKRSQNILNTIYELKCKNIGKSKHSAV